MHVRAHQAGLARTPPPPPLPVLLLVSSAIAVSAQVATDADALLRFKDGLESRLALSSWNTGMKPCNGSTANWIGVLCYGDSVWGLRLEGVGLKGNPQVEALAPMNYLRTLSFMNNELSGSMPAIKKLTGLRSLYLSNNRFSGAIPDDAFKGMGALKKVLLANNAFRGHIPSSLASLPMLLELRLNGNQFEGRIPDFSQSNLKLASFENNDLEGPIPQSLSNMIPGSFAGNKNLCGPPLGPCDARPSPPQDSHFSRIRNWSLYKAAIVLLSIGVVLLAIAMIIFILQSRRRQKSVSKSVCISTPSTVTYALPERHKIPEVAANTRKAPNSEKLIFVNDSVGKFDLQDLLRGSAEVLGSGTFGASYKTNVIGRQTLVVKRYRQMNNVGPEEFDEHMRRLGKLRHSNVLPLLAYHYRREEKLMVSQFVHNKCLASHLHANRSPDNPGLDWPTRLRIIKGVARGLSYLYSKLPMLTIPHGHLRSSNVLLDESLEPILTDHALRPVMNAGHAHKLMSAYKSPEYATKKCITKRTDVWCLGVLTLELLTGKFPEDYLTPGYNRGSSLATWVNEMVGEKETCDVFDKEMTGRKNSKGQMLSLLKLGLRCCEEDEERRMDVTEAVEKIEQLSEGDFDGDFSSMASEASMHDHSSASNRRV